MIELRIAHTARRRYAPLRSHLLSSDLMKAGMHAEMGEGAAAVLVRATEVKLSAFDSRNEEVW